MHESMSQNSPASEVVDNSLSEYLFALRKETPAKLWWDADPVHPATYRALRINPEDFAASYAVAPFRVAKIDGRHVILAAYPAPRVLDPIDHDWFRIETVIAWDPNADTASIPDDPAPQFVGRLAPEANTVFASPRAFFQSWAIRRAQFAMTRHDAAEKRWHVTPTERDEVPGALLIGELGKVRLSPSTLPEHIETVGIDPKDLNRAIMRAARLPRVSAAPSQFRRAA